MNLKKGFSRYFKEVFFKVSDQHGALLNWEIKIPHSGKELRSTCKKVKFTGKSSINLEVNYMSSEATCIQPSLPKTVC